MKTPVMKSSTLAEPAMRLPAARIPDRAGSSRRRRSEEILVAVASTLGLFALIGLLDGVAGPNERSDGAAFVPTSAASMLTEPVDPSELFASGETAEGSWFEAGH